MKENSKNLKSIQKAADTEQIVDNAQTTAPPIRSPLNTTNSFYLMNDKLTTQILGDGTPFQQKIDGQTQIKLTYATRQSPKKSPKQVATFLTLSYEGLEGKITKKLTAFDETVYTSISNLYYIWKMSTPDIMFYFTAREIVQYINGWTPGKTVTNNPSRAQIERVKRSIDKMMYTRFTMDISQELNANYIIWEDERITGGTIEDALLTCFKADFISENGRKMTGYGLHSEPILYTYNRLKKHLLKAPAKMLDVSRCLPRSTSNSTEIKFYLLHEIQKMKTHQRNSNRIKINSLYENTGIETPKTRAAKSKSKKSIEQIEAKISATDRNTIEKILMSWKKQKEIKDFTPIKNERKIIAYDIKF